MTEITLRNTRTRTKETLRPLDPSNVRMYVCGPTVYDRAHLGNARPAVVFDVLFRLLRHVYGAGHVTYVRNVTDVDDKINARAAETGRPIGDITAETGRWFDEDMAALGVLPPTHAPHATAHIGDMIAMIETLVANGNAYVAEGHVLFAVASYPDYGALSGRSTDDMIAGSRVEVAPYKRDPMDFVLWKPSGAEEPGWESPWGRGRPGWHIECSAMSRAYLGESFDIHGGGNDLLFPHHENELAQSACAHPEGDFARLWMHNEMLRVEGSKMAKSAGNFFTVRDLLDGNDEILGGAFSGDEIRLAFLLTHYRQPMDFGVKRRHEGSAALAEFAQMLGKGGKETLGKLTPGTPIEEVVVALADDLNTVEAVRIIRQNGRHLPNDPEERRDQLKRVYASQLLLGFDLKRSKAAADRAREHDDFHGVAHQASQEAELLSELSARIDAAREKKDYATADMLREAVIAAGANVSTTKEGTRISRSPEFNPEALEALK